MLIDEAEKPEGFVPQDETPARGEA
jgi:hypothetical protein